MIFSNCPSHSVVKISLKEFPPWYSWLRIWLQRLGLLRGACLIPNPVKWVKGSQVTASASRVVAGAWIQPLAWEVPCATAMTMKTKKQNRRNSLKEVSWRWGSWGSKNVYIGSTSKVLENRKLCQPHIVLGPCTWNLLWPLRRPTSWPLSWQISRWRLRLGQDVTLHHVALMVTQVGSNAPEARGWRRRLCMLCPHLWVWAVFTFMNFSYFLQKTWVTFRTINSRKSHLWEAIMPDLCALTWKTCDSPRKVYLGKPSPALQRDSLQFGKILRIEKIIFNHRTTERDETLNLMYLTASHSKGRRKENSFWGNRTSASKQMRGLWAWPNTSHPHSPECR